MNYNNIIARLRPYGRPMMRGSNHPQSIVCREAADALNDAQERIKVLEAALTRIEDLASLVAHDLTGRVEGGKVAAVYQCAEVARDALDSAEELSLIHI